MSVFGGHCSVDMVAFAIAGGVGSVVVHFCAGRCIVAGVVCLGVVAVDGIVVAVCLLGGRCLD